MEGLLAMLAAVVFVCFLAVGLILYSDNIHPAESIWPVVFCVLVLWIVIRAAGKI